MGTSSYQHMLDYQQWWRMLNLRYTQRGVTLIELVIGLVIISLVMGFGAPSFSGWIQNAKISTAAEATQNGLQLARAEAVRRNTQVRFQFTTTANNTCALSATGTNWVVSLNDPTGLCNTPPQDPPVPPALPVAGSPYIIQARSATEGSSNVAVAITPTTTTTIVFNGLGRVTPVPASNSIIDFSSTSGSSCAATGGTLRCQRVVVSRAGQIFMCDPAVTALANPNDPRLCP